MRPSSQRGPLPVSAVVTYCRSSLSRKYSPAACNTGFEGRRLSSAAMRLATPPPSVVQLCSPRNPPDARREGSLLTLKIDV